MDYGNNTLLGSSDALKRPSAGVGGVNVPARETGKHGPDDFAATALAIARDVKHPLTAILTNANAARRWLNGPAANVAEAITALDQIATDVARIDAAIDSIRAIPVEEAGNLP